MKTQADNALDILEQCANVAPVDPKNRRIALSAVDTLRDLIAEHARLIDAQTAKPDPAAQK